MAGLISKIKDFAKNNAVAMDRALNRMAVDIERGAKATVPVKQGQLKASGRHQRMGFMKYIVVFTKEYAAYQEFGKRKDGTRVVKHYTTPGTGKRYLRDAGKTVAGNAVNYLKAEAQTVKV